MKVRAIFLGILALAPASGACKKKEESLSLLVWEGYGTPARPPATPAAFCRSSPS